MTIPRAANCQMAALPSALMKMRRCIGASLRKTARAMTQEIVGLAQSNRIGHPAQDCRNLSRTEVVATERGISPERGRWTQTQVSLAPRWISAT
jgi:hypothetical protein